MKISRREFLFLTAIVTAGCSSTKNVGILTTNGERLINVGPIGNYAADGVYAAFCGQGFFIVRQGEKLFALSAICTHKRCKLKAEPDCSFYCPCHGSTFNPSGHVTHGPARRDLTVLPTFVNESGQLLVMLPVMGGPKR